VIASGAPEVRTTKGRCRGLFRARGCLSVRSERRDDREQGEGQFYLMEIANKDSRSFDGGRTYRLNVPANAPVKLYWSATVYDRATHALIREMPWSSRGSNTPGLAKNADGSIDLYFGPKAPAGKESNWVPTKSGGEFEVLFRFYGPEKPLFDKTWVLGDIAGVK
jgi:hypothetical protein